MRAQRKQRTARPPLPGEILKEVIVDRLGITQDKLAEALCVSRVTVNQIINGRRGVTADMALRLGRVTGTSPTLWLNLQREFDLFEAQGEVDLSKLTVLRKPGIVSAA